MNKAEKMLASDAMATAIDAMRKELKLKRLLTASIVLNMVMGIIVAILM